MTARHIEKSADIVQYPHDGIHRRRCPL